jgi:hypothetical protein
MFCISFLSSFNMNKNLLLFRLYYCCYLDYKNLLLFRLFIHTNTSLYCISRQLILMRLLVFNILYLVKFNLSFLGWGGGGVGVGRSLWSLGYGEAQVRHLPQAHHYLVTALQINVHYDNGHLFV